MPRLMIATLCLMLSLAVMAAEPEGRSIPYQKLYEPLAAVRQADPQGIVTSTLRAESVEEGQVLPTDLKIEIHSGTASQALPIEADGRFNLPLRADWANSGVELWVNQPKTAVKIVEHFTMRVPATTHLDYGHLMESLPVLERIRKEHAGIVILMATKPDGVELAFAQGSTQTVTIGTGSRDRTWTTDDQGHVRIPFDPKLPATAPVVLTSLPVGLEPYAN